MGWRFIRRRVYLQAWEVNEGKKVIFSYDFQRLAIMSGAQGLRFMGKIYGSKKDYLIVDGALPNAEESSTDKMVEPRG